MAPHAKFLVRYYIQPELTEAAHQPAQVSRSNYEQNKHVYGYTEKRGHNCLIPLADDFLISLDCKALATGWEFAVE